MFKPIIMSIDCMAKFEEKEMKTRSIKNNKKRVKGFKDKVINLFRANRPKQCMGDERKY